jgi:hypothetical protein
MESTDRVSSGRRKCLPGTQDRVREKLAGIIETHQPVPLGNHERSELERLRKEGEEVLKRAQYKKRGKAALLQ